MSAGRVVSQEGSAFGDVHEARCIRTSLMQGWAGKGFRPLLIKRSCQLISILNYQFSLVRIVC